MCMAIVSSVVVLCFGDWDHFRPTLSDLWPMLYVSGAVLLFPTLVSVYVQRHLDAG